MEREFLIAERNLFRRFGVEVRSSYVEVPAIGGRARVLSTGEGPPLVMVPGLSDPASMWTPLMAEMKGFSQYVVERPGAGLTDFAWQRPETLRSLAVRFLCEVMDGLGLERAAFVGNSMGSLWALWLSLDRPERVSSMVHVGCPAFILGTSAPLPMRILSVPGLGPILMRLMPPSPEGVDRLAAMANEDLSHLPEMRELLVASQRLPRASDAVLEVLHATLRLRGARPEVVLTEVQLTEVAQPVQLIWGERDPFGSVEVAARVADLLPDAALRVVPTGHIPWFSEAQQVASITTEFLQRKGHRCGDAHLGAAQENGSPS